MSERDNTWLRAYEAPTKDAWFVTISGFDGTVEPHGTASFLWPAGPQLMIPNKMVVMTVAAYADLCQRATLPGGRDDG